MTASIFSLPLPSPHWRDRAACIGADPDLFFPQRGESAEPAREICARCSVREACLDYALRNAITPVLTTTGTTLGILLGGAVVVETVFSWPGIGLLAAQGILNNDSVLVVGFTLFVATMMVFVNLLVDVLYAVVDPRVRY